MTEKELRDYVFIKARIKEIEERIAELVADIIDLEEENGLGSVNLDGMPHGSTPGDPVARMAIARVALHEDMKRLKAELEERRAELIKKEREIREYIDSVEDEEVKLIIKWWSIDLLEWNYIAGKLEELKGKNVDRTTPWKKMQKYLQEH